MKAAEADWKVNRGPEERRRPICKVSFLLFRARPETGLCKLDYNQKRVILKPPDLLLSHVSFNLEIRSVPWIMGSAGSSPRLRLIQSNRLHLPDGENSFRIVSDFTIPVHYTHLCRTNTRDYGAQKISAHYYFSFWIIFDFSWY